MKSVVNDTDGIVRVAESVIPEIKHQDEVRVKIASSGLCGSDLPRIFKNGAHYYPITLGHEFSGYIDAVEAAHEKRESVSNKIRKLKTFALQLRQLFYVCQFRLHLYVLKIFTSSRI